MTLALKNSASLIVTFIFIELAIFTSQNTLASLKIDTMLLMYANIFFLSISLVSLFIQQKAMRHENPNVFVRSVMGSILAKMMLTAFAVIIYVFASGESFNKRGVFISLFIYLVYLSVEVITLMKMNKKSNG